MSVIITRPVTSLNILLIVLILPFPDHPRSTLPRATNPVTNVVEISPLNVPPWD